MNLTRRDVGKIALASWPAMKAFGAKRIDSKFNGVQIGAITYSFNRIASPDAEAIIRAYVDIGLGEAELMSNHCESLAGAPAMPAFGRGPGGGLSPEAAAAAARSATTAAAAAGSGSPEAAAAAARNAAIAAVQGGGPPAGGEAKGGERKGGGGRPQMTPEQQEEMRAVRAKLVDWRKSTGPDTWKKVAKKFSDAGVEVELLCYNMQDNMKDEDIEYGFAMAKGLGVKGITTSTTLTMAKRIAPVADRHKLLVGYHGHDATNNPNQTATLESYDTLMAYGKFNGVNLDIGHFTAAGYDAVAFIQQHHAKITNLHVKDRKKDHGPNVAVWGTGDTPIKDVLQLLKKQKYGFPANLELEYQIPPDSDIIAEAKKCLAYVKSCLA